MNSKQSKQRKYKLIKLQIGKIQRRVNKRQIERKSPHTSARPSEEAETTKSYTDSSSSH